MSKFNFEVRKLTIDDLELSPECFANDQDGHAIVGKMAHYAQFYVEGIKNPVYWFRNVEPHCQRWCGISELGDGLLEPQNGLHGDDLAQADTTTIHYQKVCDHPKTLEIKTEEPYSLIRFTDDGDGGVIAEFKEGKDGCILDLKAIPMPKAVINHSSTEIPSPYFQVNTIVSGTYMGKPVKGMGGFDRTYLLNKAVGIEDEEEALYTKTYRCNCALYSGVREDGRKEFCNAQIMDENGKGIGVYYIDGEETIVTENVHLDAKFQHLPYVDDGTVVFTKAVWKIGPKTIHFNGKWGTKGFTAYPKIEKHGQSQCLGHWYEGDEPYEHVLEHTFTENSGDAYDYRIKEMGFEVID